ncbi:MAG: Rrf2 family transcriptional regulator [Clostridiaceae bacterium]|nr:Rrf2 family transcriptional regulator [Clostridiaceae bacterium]
MRISAKGRYALAAMISMAQNYENGEYITVISLSEKLGVSKIYLEQVFSLLKRSSLLNSTKGAQGGYRLTRAPRLISVLDILSAIELSLFEKAEEAVAVKAPEIDRAMRAAAFEPLDEAVRTVLQQITLVDLINEVEKQKTDHNFMFFI